MNAQLKLAATLFFVAPVTHAVAEPVGLSNDCGSCGYYVPADGSAEVAQSAAAPQPRFALGVFGSEHQFEDSVVVNQSTGLAAKLRLTKGGALWLEGELSQTDIEEGAAHLSRVGSALYLEGPASDFRVFALFGAGVVHEDIAGRKDTAAYAEGGIGFAYRFRITPGTWLDFAFDFRAGNIQEGEDSPPRYQLEAAPPPPELVYEPQTRGDYTRGRITMSLAF